MGYFRVSYVSLGIISACFLYRCIMQDTTLSVR